MYIQSVYGCMPLMVATFRWRCPSTWGAWLLKILAYMQNAYVKLCVWKRIWIQPPALRGVLGWLDKPSMRRLSQPVPTSLQPLPTSLARTVAPSVAVASDCPPRSRHISKHSFPSTQNNNF